MLPLYTSTLYLPDKSDYGDYTLIYTFMAFMNLFYLYGMDSAFLRYSYDKKYDRKDVYATAFFAVGGSAFILSLVIFFSASASSTIIFGAGDYQFFVKAAALILLFDTFSNLPYLILRVEEKSISYSTIRIIRFLIELMLNIWFLVFLKLGIKGILYANIIAAFINILILLPFQIKYLKGLFKRAIFLSLIKFGLPIIPNSLAYLVVEISDKYLMRVLLDKEQLGIYSANYKFGSIILFLIIAFRTAWQPFFLKISETNDAKKIYAKVLTYFSLAGVLLVIFVTFFIEYLVAMPLPGNFTLLGKSYWSGIQIIPIILTSYLFYGFYVNFTVGVFITKKTKLMVIFTGLAAIINISSNFYLMPAFGIMGAAIATLLSYFVMALSIFVANQKIYKINYEFKRIISLLILLFSVLFIYYYFNPDIWIRIAILIVIPFLLFTMGFFKSAEIRASKELFKL